MNLHFLPIHTRTILPPKDDPRDILDSLDVKDGDIIFITSKIVSIWEGKTVPAAGVTKASLAEKEASRFLEYSDPSGVFTSHITVNKNILILSAGIDASNAGDYYVLWPDDPDLSCRRIRDYLMKKHSLKHLGVVMTDSHSTPLRLGVTGFTIGLAGLDPLKDIRGLPDLFGRKMKFTRVNLIDPLSSMAVLLMGETNESTPICILRDYSGIPFSDSGSMKGLLVDPDFDIYGPLIKAIPKVSDK